MLWRGAGHRRQVGRVAHRPCCLVILLVYLHTLVRPRQQCRAILPCQRPCPKVIIVRVVTMILAELSSPKSHQAPVHHGGHHGFPPTKGPVETLINGLPLGASVNHQLASRGPAAMLGLYLLAPMAHILGPVIPLLPAAKPPVSRIALLSICLNAHWPAVLGQGQNGGAAPLYQLHRLAHSALPNPRSPEVAQPVQLSADSVPKRLSKDIHQEGIHGMLGLARW